MPYSESFYIRLVALPIAGLGAIYLTVSGGIAPEAGAAILASLVAFVVGEQNGKRNVLKANQ